MHFSLDISPEKVTVILISVVFVFVKWKSRKNTWLLYFLNYGLFLFQSSDATVSLTTYFFICILQVLDATLKKVPRICPLTIVEQIQQVDFVFLQSSIKYAAAAVFGCVDKCLESFALVLSQGNTMEVHMRKEMFDPSLKLQNLLLGRGGEGRRRG